MRASHYRAKQIAFKAMSEETEPVAQCGRHLQGCSRGEYEQMASSVAALPKRLFLKGPPPTKPHRGGGLFHSKRAHRAIVRDESPLREFIWERGSSKDGDEKQVEEVQAEIDATDQRLVWGFGRFLRRNLSLLTNRTFEPVGLSSSFRSGYIQRKAKPMRSSIRQPRLLLPPSLRRHPETAGERCR